MENDITDQKLKQEMLRRSAAIDGLTGLYNKTTTEQYIEAFLRGEGADGKHALIIMDIDFFKSVNDELGHAKGDEILAECGQTLRKIFRKNDIVGRVGGDEFMVLLKDYGDRSLIMTKMDDVIKNMCQEHLQEDTGKRVRTTASIGIALYDEDGRNFDELYKSADIALYVSKKNG
ncbi:MAG: GGDEF domain-containing protein, partial [Anaerovorax sp.]